MRKLSYTFHLLDIAKSNFKNKISEALKWVKRASNSTINKSASLHISRLALYLYYYYSNNNLKKAIKLATQAYKEGDLEFGCSLAQHYSSSLIFNNKQNPDIDNQKSFDIAEEVIKKEPNNKFISSCYQTLSNFYLFGTYRPKDIKKSLKLMEKSYNNFEHLRDSIGERIAELYLEQLEDYKNATLWYKKVYELIKNT